MTGEHAFHRPRGKVLRVDPEPVPAAAREVEETFGIDVAQVARPVPPVAQPVLFGVVPVVVALELAAPAAVHDLADGGAGVEQPPALVELGSRTLPPVAASTTAKSTPPTGFPSAPLGIPSTGLMATPPSL